MRWSGRDVVAVVLAVAIGLAVLLPLVIGALRGAPMSEAGAELLAVVEGAALGAIGTYLGGAGRDFGAPIQRDNKRAPDPGAGREPPSSSS